MTISFVQSGTGIGGFSTTQVLAYSSNVALGNLLVCVVSTKGIDNAPTGITDSRFNTWAKLVPDLPNSSVGSFQTTLSIWYAYSGSSAANTVTVTVPRAQTSAWGMTIVEYSGLTNFRASTTATQMVAMQASYLGTTTSPSATVGPLSPLTDTSMLLLAAACIPVSATITVLSGGFGSRGSEASAVSQAVADRHPIAGTTSYSIGWSEVASNTYWVGYLLAINSTYGTQYLSNPNDDVFTGVADGTGALARVMRFLRNPTDTVFLAADSLSRHTLFTRNPTENVYSLFAETVSRSARMTSMIAENTYSLFAETIGRQWVLTRGVTDNTFTLFAETLAWSKTKFSQVTDDLFTGIVGESLSTVGVYARGLADDFSTLWVDIATNSVNRVRNVVDDFSSFWSESIGRIVNHVVSISDVMPFFWDGYLSKYLSNPMDDFSTLWAEVVSISRHITMQVADYMPFFNDSMTEHENYVRTTHGENK